MEKIIYGLHDSPFGEMVLGQSEAGLCWLGFMVQGRKGNGLSRMTAYFKNAAFERDDAATQTLCDQVIAAWEQGAEIDVPLDIRGSDFQMAVWQKLLQIERGRTLTYAQIANDIGKPKAARAVGSAVGENPISLIVPCHRVLPASGGVGHYGWGSDMKRKMLQAEGVVSGEW